MDSSTASRTLDFGYDPRLGRLLSPDPIVGDPTSSQSWNLYSYVGNNPLSYVDPTGLVRAGPMCPVGGAMMCMDGGGGGGGSTARTVTVTETVYGVVAIPYGHSVPSWTRVWDRGLDHYVWDLSYDHYWAFEYRTFSYDVTRTIMLEDHSVADQPADLGGLGIAAADIGASILIPGYDLVRCNMVGNCEWTDWAVGVGEIAMTAIIVGYGVRVLAKAGTKGANRSRAVIGKVDDLRSIGEHEHTLLKHLPDQGNPKANWKQNASVLRREMRKGQPIREASLNPDGTLRQVKGFLKAERTLLESHRWKYDSHTQTWRPPR